MRHVAYNLRPSSHRRCADPPPPAPPSPRWACATRARGLARALSPPPTGNPVVHGPAHLARDNTRISAPYVRLAAHFMRPTVPIQVWDRRTLCGFLHPKCETAWRLPHPGRAPTARPACRRARGERTPTRPQPPVDAPGPQEHGSSPRPPPPASGHHSAPGTPTAIVGHDDARYGATAAPTPAPRTPPPRPPFYPYFTPFYPCYWTYVGVIMRA